MQLVTVRPDGRDREFLADIAPFFMSKEVRREMPYLSDAPGRTWILARLDDAVIGIGYAEVIKGEVHLGGLYVLPKARGQGIASALIDARLALHPILPARTVANPASAPFYLRRGFTVFFRRGSYAHLRRD